MIFFLLNLNLFEYAERYCFPQLLDDPYFDRFMSFAAMSHCNFDMLGTGDAGVLEDIMTNSGSVSVADSAYESTDRMQLVVFNVAFGSPFASPIVDKIYSVRATVFMDILLFRRNLQIELVSAEDFCPGCLAHKGYMQNFLALSPHFQNAADCGSGANDKKCAVVGSSSGGAMAILGGIQMVADSMPPTQIRTAGMPRMGNKALANFVGTLSFDLTSYIYYRDPMVHHPPTIFGYRHVSGQQFVWMYRTGAADVSNTETRTDGLRQGEMDPYIANKIWFFRVTDHMMYFATPELLKTSRSVDDALSACGQYSDTLLVEYHTSDLFNF